MTESAGVTEGLGHALLSVAKCVVAVPLSVLCILESFLKVLVPKRLRMKSLKGQTALITGGGSGIGRELALELAKQGVKVIIWGRSLHTLEETRNLVEKVSGSCYIYQVDVTDNLAVYRTAEELLREHGKVDILFNNAGIVKGKSILELKDEDVMETMTVNCISHFYTTRAFLPRMMDDNSGHIVTIASMAGYMGSNRLTDYCASKHAAVGFNESLKHELMVTGYSGIKTTLVCSFFINTGMFKGVKSSLLPVMNQKEVAHSAITSVRLDNQYCMPVYGGALIASINMFPVRALGMFNEILGINSCMSEFKGKTPITQNGIGNGISNGIGNTSSEGVRETG